MPESWYPMMHDLQQVQRECATLRDEVKRLTIANEKQDMTINSFRGTVHILETVIRDAMPLFQGHLVHESSRTEWLVHAHCALGEIVEEE